MKPQHLLLLLGVTAFAACQSPQNKKPKASFQLPFRKDSMAGSWMVTSITTDKKNKTEADTALNTLENNIRLTAYHFQPNGELIIDYATPELSKANWAFNNKSKQLLIQYQDTTLAPLSFTIKRYQNDELTLENNHSVTIDNFLTGAKDSFHVQYIAKRLRTNDSVPDLFDPALNKWRHKPANAEDDAAIKSRLKQVLYYYSAYFANIKGNKIPVFNIDKILCPIKFYSGGIGMKRFKENDGWTKVFFDNKDAKKAHQMLDNAFTNIKGYPDKGGDYVHEYIIALKIVADAL